MAAPRQEVTTLPLAPSLRQSLLSAGFRTVADLYGVGPVDLSSGTADSGLAPQEYEVDIRRQRAELGVTPDEALLVLKVADVHKTSGLLGKLSCSLLTSVESIHSALKGCSELRKV